MTSTMEINIQVYNKRDRQLNNDEFLKMYIFL